MKKVVVIGAGFSGLASAACLADSGFDVSVFEKNLRPGGRARKFSSQGFVFDMGPSWYWMPDVFEKFFEKFNKKVSDYYQLTRLDPSYRIYFDKKDYLDVPATVEKLCCLFDEMEKGAGEKLLKFLDEAKFKYEVGINKLVYKPGLQWSELLDWNVIRGVFRLQLFSSVSSNIRKYFSNPRIIQLLEFPVLFLGATSQNTPALYTLMNYADMALGTWYPQGGMYKVVDAMEKLAKEKGVQFFYDNPAQKVNVNDQGIKSISHRDGEFATDYVVASADYHHVEQNLLPREVRKYETNYWGNRTFAPSSLIFFLGLNKRINGLRHHTLFFDEDFTRHAEEIYKKPQWPTAPQFYISCPSKTDPSVAPEGCENLMILIPVAAGLTDTEETREKYFQIVIKRLESILEEKIEPYIVVKRSYAHRDFITDYNAYKGNAYGLANTLMQTANLKPSMVNSKIKNLVYAGQLTVPGPGVPPSIISGQVAAQLIKDKALNKF
jgi:phytoene desaturase